MTTVTQNTRNDADTIAPTLMIIGGHARDSANGTFIDVENPANRTIVGRVPRAGDADVDAAVRAAASAFEQWRAVAPRDRGRALVQIADALEADLESVARILALETGNAIRPQARPEVKGAADVFRYFGGLASELKGETIPLGEHVLCYTRREPIGVVGAIVPWNAPVVLGALKVAMAVAAGNTLVLKAAEDAPLALLRVAQICGRHLPPGVLNLITGYGEECGAALARHPLVRKLSFTGSTEVGKSIMHAAADRIVPVSLELGGKSPALVFPDADEDRTVDGVIAGMRVTRQGQSCTAGSRLFLHRSIFESFLAKLADKLAAFRIGDPLDETTDMGAIISRKQFDRVCGYIDDGLRQPGARRVLGGLPPPGRTACAGLLCTADGVRRRPERLADCERGDLRPRDGGDPLGRRSGRGPDGERQPLRAGRIRLDARSRQGDSHRARDRIRMGPDQPGTRPVSGTGLRRLQAERHRPRVLARGDARQLYPAKERHRQPPALNLANAGSSRHSDVRSATGIAPAICGPPPRSRGNRPERSLLFRIAHNRPDAYLKGDDVRRANPSQGTI